MATKKSKTDKANWKLVTLRLATLAIIAYLLVLFDIVNNSDASKNIETYIFAALVALPLTMLLDRYIVAFAKKH